MRAVITDAPPAVDDQLLHDGRFIAVLASANPVAEDPVEMLFDAYKVDDAAAKQLAADPENWLFAEKLVNYEPDGDVLWK